jgi:hypothetical protein
LKILLFDEKISSDGSVETGVCRTDLVVGGMVARSDAIGPVTVGYVPVQYDTDVVISGVGKTKLISVPPYAMILVVRPRACATDELNPEEADKLSEAWVDPSVTVLVWIVMNPVSELDDTKLEVMFKLDEEDVDETELELELVVRFRDLVDDNHNDDEDEDKLVSRLLDDDDAFTGGTRVLKTPEGPELDGRMLAVLEELIEVVLVIVIDDVVLEGTEEDLTEDMVVLVDVEVLGADVVAVGLVDDPDTPELGLDTLEPLASELGELDT